MMKKYALFVAVAVFLLGVLSVKTIRNRNSVPPVLQIPTQMTLQGEYVCLPHKNTSGPITLECALGLKSDDGAYYALDTTNVSFLPQETPTGTHLQVQGLVVPIEQISSNAWQKYDIRGIMQVAAVKKI